MTEEDQFRGLIESVVRNALQQIQDLAQSEWVLDTSSTTLAGFDEGKPIFERKEVKSPWRTGYGTRGLNCSDVVGYQPLLAFTSNTPILQRYFGWQENPNAADQVIFHSSFHAFLRELVNECRDVTLPLSKEVLETKVAPRVTAIFAKKLPVQLFIPIVGASFAEDLLCLGDGVSIRLLDNSAQELRMQEYTAASRLPRSFVQNATHAIYIDGYAVENRGLVGTLVGLGLAEFYPLEVADRVLAAVRLVRPCAGYSQLCAEPVGWSNHRKRLFVAYTTDRLLAPQKDLNTLLDRRESPQWSRLTAEECNAVVEMYEQIQEVNKSQLHFALRRLNSASLRHDDLDAILDASTALEALLTHDARSEITYRLSMRAAYLSTLAGHDAPTFRDVIKKVYNCRSQIAHGNEAKLQKAKVIKMPDREPTQAVDEALNALRIVIKVLLEHPRFFDPKIIDDELLSDRSSPS